RWPPVLPASVPSPEGFSTLAWWLFRLRARCKRDSTGLPVPCARGPAQQRPQFAHIPHQPAFTTLEWVGAKRRAPSRLPRLLPASVPLSEDSSNLVGCDRCPVLGAGRKVGPRVAGVQVASRDKPRKLDTFASRRRE